jgi:multiple sugar transport system permease protein
MTPKAKRKFKEGLTGYLFILPNVLGFAIFTFLPVFASMLMSFTAWNGMGGLSSIQFNGLGNFRDLMHDELFWKFLWNTVYLMFSLPVSMAGSLILALALNQKIKGITFFRTVYFLPSITAGIALFMMWKWIYNPDYGLLNDLLRNWFKIEGPAWLSDLTWVKPALIICLTWIGIGGTNMILYIAGLQNIPRDFYEAASIDGASSWQRFWAITWPMLTPTTFFIFIMGLIGGFQGYFDLVYIMTGGGPAGASTPIAYYIWQTAFQNFKIGYAAAQAWALFIVIFIITLINWRYSGSKVQYF